MACPFALTKDGIETQFGTNHVGHYLLTTELIPRLLNSTEPRIVNVSSLAHKLAPKDGILFDKINDEEAQNTFSRYGQSKLANILFTNGLNKRYGEKIYVNSVHPGMVNTELDRGIKDSLGWMYYPFVPLHWVLWVFQMNSAQGALTSLYLGTSPDIVEKKIKAKYFIPYACEANTTEIAQDAALADKLWKFTDNLVKEKLQA